MFFLILSLFMQTALSQAPEAQVPLETQDLREVKLRLLYDFKKYENADQIDFVQVLKELGDKTQNYIKFRTAECKGEFSIVEINEDGESIKNKKKLTKTESKLCMLDLINFQRRYISAIYALRKRFLLKSHLKQLEELENDRQEGIKELEKLSARYR